MNNVQKIKIANYLRYFARYMLLALMVLTFVFAIVSGAERNGGGIYGIVQNSPNALPWLILLAMIYVAWKWELIGGIVISLSGIGMIFFFHLFSSNFHLVVLILTLLIVMLGFCFVLSWYFRKNAI